MERDRKIEIGNELLNGMLDVFHEVGKELTQDDLIDIMAGLSYTILINPRCVSAGEEYILATCRTFMVIFMMGIRKDIPKYIAEMDVRLKELECN